MDSYPLINCFTQASLMLFRTWHEILETLSFNTDWSQKGIFLWGQAGWMLPPSAQCSTDVGRGDAPNEMC